MKAHQLLPHLYCFRDTCNVYVLRDGDRALAVDFGSGAWRAQLRQLGVRKLTDVFLTHHHADQCAGLLRRRRWNFVIHAPTDEQTCLSPRGVRDYWRARRQIGGCPPSYAVLPRGIPDVRYDCAGFADHWWGGCRLRFIHTPGHGPQALSLVADIDEQQVVFCGDAAHAGATIWQPYHLEWDHWTGSGALAAWQGVQRLANLGMDLLCPAHGPVISRQPRRLLRQLAGRLLEFYHVKGHICPGERDAYLTPELLRCGARRLSPHLIQFGANGYLLLSDTGESLVVDGQASEVNLLESLRRELGGPRVTAAVATHYHCDHSDGLPVWRQRFGAKVWLHPLVARPLQRLERLRYPWLPRRAIRPDELWPARGRWRWNEYTFQVAPFSGQTRWHATAMVTVDGQRVLLGGDNFQPPSRWNGTGGFCAFNGSRFEGFRRSAQLVLDWQPDWLATGHQTYYRFRPAQFRKIIRWATRAERATVALCPRHSLRRDYDLHR